MPDRLPPIRMKELSTSGVERCPLCDSDLLVFKEGWICCYDGKHYNVSHEEHERIQAGFRTAFKKGNT